MPRTAMQTRRATNVTLPADLLRDARQAKINISQACEEGLKAAMLAERRARWLEENREAFAWWNDYVEKNGLPLAEYRQF